MIRMPHKSLAWQVLLATPKGKAAQSPTKDHMPDYISDLAWSHLGVD